MRSTPALLVAAIAAGPLLADGPPRNDGAAWPTLHGDLMRSGFYPQWPDAEEFELVRHGYKSKDPGRPPGRKDTPWMCFNAIGDETQTLAVSPRYLFSIHQGYIGSLAFDTGLLRNMFGKRDTYGGFYGPGHFGWASDGGVEKARKAGVPYGIVNEWHGPARAVVSVAGEYVYYPVGSQVICIKGK